jgi:hypothetical protein
MFARLALVHMHAIKMVLFGAKEHLLLTRECVDYKAVCTVQAA